MKYSTAISMALAPVAMAKAVRNKHPEIKRSPEPNAGVGVAGVAGVAGGFGGVAVGGAAVIGVAVPAVAAPLGTFLLWTNQGGGAQPNIINSQVTVTQTVTVPAGGAPTAIAGVDGVTTTVQPGATAVIPGTGATHSVTVGGPQGLSFFPQEINAAVGDTLIFNFMAQNHTVTQSTFDNPCDALAGGMDSGFMANPDNTIVPAPQVAMQVMTEEPLWMFCAQGNHCGQGMVFSINPTLERTHAEFQSLAISQRGNNPGTAITGGAPAANDPAAVAPPAADPNADPNAVVDPAADPNAVVAAPSGVDVAAPVNSIATDPLNGNLGAMPAGVFMGNGQVQADGSCLCMVSVEDSSSQAAAAGVGAGGFGGVAGILPMDSSSIQAAAAGGVGAASVPEVVADAPVGALSDPAASAAADPASQGAPEIAVPA